MDESYTRIIKNRYVDSVTLMGIADKVRVIEGIKNIEVQMGTPVNISFLHSQGFIFSDEVTSNDIVIAIHGVSSNAIVNADSQIENLLNNQSGLAGQTKRYNSISEIDFEKDPYDLCQISLPGEYVYPEAIKAIEKGLDVFIFSDNVSIEDELRLKQAAQKNDVIVMGPDCGVGLIDGVALATGSIIREGAIGIIGASGSGAQEIACIIERSGGGVSAIIGTGGRDLYPQIGGISMQEGMRRLDKDPNTKVLCLVSKIADKQVMSRILDYADSLSKPVVAIFLGVDHGMFEHRKTIGVYSLRDAAWKSMDILQDNHPSNMHYNNDVAQRVQEEISKLTTEQKFLRGLYCGGTFTEESLIYFAKHPLKYQMHCNLHTPYANQLKDSLISIDHSLIDLGAEEFTAETPHPVFDPSIRLQRFITEMKDPHVALILLDFITGPGVHPDPITPFIDKYKKLKESENRHVILIVNICGSYEDPQDIKKHINNLKEVGAIVVDSNWDSAELAYTILSKLERRN